MFLICVDGAGEFLNVSDLAEVFGLRPRAEDHCARVTSDSSVKSGTGDIIVGLIYSFSSPTTIKHA